mmetsp:Transcript_107630/g.169939  ORF Transcript_107630/g.169939 Transcript_107630/m.169939 type:complete len:221 (+) Transcript_107630:75-737(+)
MDSKCRMDSICRMDSLEEGLDKCAQHLLVHGHRDARLRWLPPAISFHILARIKHLSQQALVILFLPLHGEQQAATSHPTQVASLVLQVILIHPMISARLRVEYGPDGKPIHELNRIVFFLERGVGFGYKSFDALVHDFPFLFLLRLFIPLEEFIHASHHEWMASEGADGISNAHGFFRVHSCHEMFWSTDNSYGQATAKCFPIAEQVGLDVIRTLCPFPM